MILNIASTPEIIPFITNKFTENDVGIILNSNIPSDAIVAIDIDSYYHKLSLSSTPEIADILFVLRSKLISENFSIFIIEMKNICSPKYFSVQNIYNKFNTAIEDFIKNRHNNIFLDTTKNVVNFKLYFISDAYKLKNRGFTDTQIKSFLNGTKIDTLQSMQPFTFRCFKALIEYKLPNPLIDWE